MGLRLQPRDNTFFDLFSVAGSNIVASVELLREYVRAPQDRRPELAARMHESEHAGDDTTHAIIEQLDRSFITPLGVGATRRRSAVRWAVAGEIATGWVLTLPAATAVAAVVYTVTRLF